MRSRLSRANRFACTIESFWLLFSVSYITNCTKHVSIIYSTNSVICCPHGDCKYWSLRNRAHPRTNSIRSDSISIKQLSVINYAILALGLLWLRKRERAWLNESTMTARCRPLVRHLQLQARSGLDISVIDSGHVVSRLSTGWGMTDRQTDRRTWNN